MLRTSSMEWLDNGKKLKLQVEQGVVLVDLVKDSIKNCVEWVNRNEYRSDAISFAVSRLISREEGYDPSRLWRTIHFWERLYKMISEDYVIEVGYVWNWYVTAEVENLSPKILRTSLLELLDEQIIQEKLENNNKITKIWFNMSKFLTNCAKNSLLAKDPSLKTYFAEWDKVNLFVRGLQTEPIKLLSVPNLRSKLKNWFACMEVVEQLEPIADYIDLADLFKGTLWRVEQMGMSMPALRVDNCLQYCSNIQRQYERWRNAEKNEQFVGVTDTWNFLNYEDDSFKVIIPHSCEDLIDEGEQQHNCVGSYIDNVIDEDCYVIFIRRKSDLKKSLVTVELDLDFELVQGLMKNNTSIKDKEIADFLEKYLKNLQQYKF